MNVLKAAGMAVAFAVCASGAHAAVVTYDASNAVSAPKADGSGADNHSFIFNDSVFTFVDGATFTFDDETGQASLTGFASDDDDATGNSGIDVTLSFDAVDWTDLRTPKIELSQDLLGSAGIDPERDWLAFELVEEGARNSILTVVGDIDFSNRDRTSLYSFEDGDIFDVYSKPTDGSHVFQMGKGANGKNLNFGMSGWFGFFADGEDFCADRNVCDGNMDFSLSVAPPEVPLPASAFLMIAGLGTLLGLRCRA